MTNKWLIYLWLIPLALIFPLLQLLIFFWRFQRLPASSISESLVFLPMGVIGGAVLIYSWQHATQRPAKILASVGFGLAIPFALAAALFSGLMLDPLIGTSLCGSLPLIIGSVIGYLIGRRFN